MSETDIKSILKSYLGPSRPPEADQPRAEKINLSDRTLEAKPEKRYKPAWIKKIFYGIFLTIFIFLVGGVAGIIFDRWFIPYLVTIPAFGQFSWLKRIEERTIIINRTEEVKISEDLAILEAIKKAKSTVVEITISYKPESKSKTQKIKLEQIYTETINGVIITSDGLILARPSYYFFTTQEYKNRPKYIEYKIEYKVNLPDNTKSDIPQSQIFPYDFEIPRDNPLANLIILKIKSDNLPVLAFVDSGETQLGEPVAVIGQAVARGTIAQIRTVESTQNLVAKKQERREILIDRDLPNDDAYRGAILVNLKGEILGLNIVNSENKITNAFIPINDIKSFIDSVIGKLR